MYNKNSQTYSFTALIISITLGFKPVTPCGLHCIFASVLRFYSTNLIPVVVATENSPCHELLSVYIYKALSQLLVHLLCDFLQFINTRILHGTLSSSQYIGNTILD